MPQFQPCAAARPALAHQGIPNDKSGLDKTAGAGFDRSEVIRPVLEVCGDPDLCIADLASHPARSAISSFSCQSPSRSAAPAPGPAQLTRVWLALLVGQAMHRHQPLGTVAFRH
jgi:hypothetical protein